MIAMHSTTNPIFRNFPASAPAVPESDPLPRMSFRGALRKTVILTLWTAVCAVWIWRALTEPDDLQRYEEKFFLVLLVFSALAPFGMVTLSLWRKTLSPFTAPIYAMLQGVFLGFVSVALERRHPGVAMQIFCLTFTVCIGLAVSYRYGLISAADHYNKKIGFAILAGALYVAGAVLLPHIGIHIFPLVIHGPAAAFSAVIVIISGVIFVSGFDLAFRSAQQNQPQYMEWHAAFGLSLAVIWLYLEGLRLFVKDRIPNEAAHT